MDRASATKVIIEGQDRRLELKLDETILDGMRRLGHPCRYSCRRGGCGTCKADLVQGEVSYTDNIAASVLGEEERAAGAVLLCRAVPIADVTIRLRGSASIRRPCSGLLGST